MLNVSVTLSPETQRLNCVIIIIFIFLILLTADEVHSNNLLKAPSCSGFTNYYARLLALFKSYSPHGSLCA